MILDFNYTKTIENILITMNLSDDDINKRLIKIHGSLEDGIIFGVEDKADIKNEHVFLRKAFNEKYKAINIIDILQYHEEIHIFGHSLGETDHMYFEDYFRKISMPNHSNEKSKIHLYHYGHDSYTQLFIQLDKLTNKSLTNFKRNNEFKTIDVS